MMGAKEYLGRSRLFRRLKSGPQGQLVELYAARLVKDGLARQGTWRCLSLVSGLLNWIAGSRSKLTDLDEGMIERYLLQRAGKQFIQPGDRAALKRLLSVLRDAGTIRPATLPPITPQDQIFEEFSDYPIATTTCRPWRWWLGKFWKEGGRASQRERQQAERPNGSPEVPESKKSI